MSRTGTPLPGNMPITTGEGGMLQPQRAKRSLFEFAFSKNLSTTLPGFIERPQNAIADCLAEGSKPPCHFLSLGRSDGIQHRV
jgi:hypothetical protein